MIKNRWSNIVKDYLTFSARDRNGIILLFLLGFIIYFSFKYFPVKKQEVSKTAFQQELAQLKISIDSATHNTSYNKEDDNIDYRRPKRYENFAGTKAELFAFDPNTLDADGWKRLGLREKTITTIQNFIAKGYKFRHPEDLQKVYGLRKEDAERLIPYVHIAEKEVASNSSFLKDEKTVVAKTPAKEATRNSIIDVNAADSIALVALPGIGSKLASRIINFRQKLGGFSSVSQVGETYGVPDSTFQLIKPRLSCANPVLKTININTADVNALRTHPYIRWNIANAIINYRTQHGNYKSVDDIRKIDVITEEQFNKIAPYLTI